MIKKLPGSASSEQVNSKLTMSQGVTREEIRTTLSQLDRMIQQGALSKDDVRSHKEALVRSLTSPHEPLAAQLQEESPSKPSAYDPYLTTQPQIAPLPSRLLASLVTSSGNALDTQGRLALPTELVNQSRPMSQAQAGSPSQPQSFLNNARLSIGTVLNGRYRLDTDLGGGSNGQVFQATDLRWSELRAVKVLRPRLVQRQGFLAQLSNVQRALQHIEHKSIARSYGIERDQESGLVFQVMEFVDGLTISTLLERARTQGITPLLPFTTTLIFLRKLMAALSFLHKHDIVHRNLKPSNIILVPGNQGFSLKLLDIGLPGELRESIHPIQHQEEISKLFYMAPEQLAGQGPFLPSTDLYSVGILLYLMLTDVFPSALSPRPSEINPIFTQALDRSLQHAVQMSPRQRPQSCADFFGEFSQALNLPVYTNNLYLPKELLTPPRQHATTSQSSIDLLRSRASSHSSEEHLTETPRRSFPSLPLAASPLPVALIPESYLPQYEDALQDPLVTLPILNASVAPPQSSLNQSETFLATTHNPGSIQLWETDAWRPLYNIRSPQALSTITALAWSQSSDLLAFASANGDVWVWNCLNDRCLAHFPHTSPVRCLLWLPQERSLCVGCADGRIHFWSPSQSKHLGYNMSHRYPITALQCHPKGRFLASSDEGGYCHLIDLETGETHLALPPSEGALQSLAFEHRDGHVLVGGHDGMVQLWDLEQGIPRHFCLGHRGAINALAVCHTESWFASGADDATIGIWSLDSGQRIATFEGHEAPIHSLCIARDGHWLTSTSQDGTLKVWQTTFIEKLF